MENFQIFSGNSNPAFSQAVAKALEIPLGKCQLSRFADGEVQVEIDESVRGHHVFVIQSCCHPVNESYMELFILLDALKRASAETITAIIPYYGYARQDRKVAPRAPISAKRIANLLESCGVDRIVTVELHSGQIQGFFDCPVDHLFSIPSIARYWEENLKEDKENFVIVSPDPGGVQRVQILAKAMKTPLAIIDKRRSGPNRAKAFHLIGNVKGKTAVIFDDIIDTAGTTIEASQVLLKNGAKDVIAIATHGVFSPPASERLKQSSLSQIWVTDTIPLRQELKNYDKLKVISVAPVVAEAIKRIYNHQSVTSLFHI